MKAPSSGEFHYCQHRYRELSLMLLPLYCCVTAYQNARYLCKLIGLVKGVNNHGFWTHRALIKLCSYLS